MGGGEIGTVNMTPSAVPDWFHNSHLDLTAGYRFPVRSVFLYSFFATGNDDKAIFSIPGDPNTNSYVVAVFMCTVFLAFIYCTAFIVLDS
jgi:hypothetical protein